MRGQEEFPTSVLTVGIHYAAEVSRHSIHYRFTTVGRGSGIEWEERTSRFYGLFVRTGKDHGYVLRAGMLTSRLELKIKSMNVYIFDLDLNSRLCKRLPKAQTSSVTKDCRCVQKNVLMSVSHTSAKKGDLDTEGVNVDGENLSNLRFADDVALLNETSKQMEKHMNNLNSESMKVGLKIHKGKTKYMTNYADNEDILIGQQKIEKVTEFKYLGQTTHLKDTTKAEIYARIRAGWSCFGKNKEILQDKQLPISLKKQVMDQCILPTMTYGCQTWSLNKQMTNKLRTAQRAMERKMLDLKLKDKIPCAEIRKRTKIIDIIEYTLKQKWKWAGHIARLKDNWWTRRCTEWQPRRGKRSRGRPSRRWQDDITEKEGTTWIRKATDRRRWKTLMEGYILQWMDKA